MSTTRAHAEAVAVLAILRADNTRMSDQRRRRLAVAVVDALFLAGLLPLQVEESPRG